MLAIDAAAAAAAEIAAAEAAAVAAAEAAAATAAQQAAAITAAETAATTAATQAGAQGAQAGIMELGNTAANAPLTSEAVNAAAQQANAGIPSAPPDVMSPAQRAYMEASSAGFNSGITPGTKPLPAYNNPFPTFDGPVTSSVSGIDSVPGFQGTTSGPQGASPGLFNPTQAPGQGPLQYQLSAPNTSQGIKLGSSLEGMSAPTTPMTSVLSPPSALESGMNTAIKFAKENPFTAMTGAYGAANMLGLMKPSGETFNDKEYDGPLNKYRLSDDFQTGSANPEDFQYTPRRYALGGVMDAGPVQAMSDQNNMQEYQRAMTATGGQVANFAKGGSLSDSIDSYQRMLSGKPMEPPARSADVGIYYDQDPDTRYQDPLTAAQIRQAKVNQRAYVSPPVAKRPTPMGQLQMASVKPRKQGGGDVEAASGGIMHSSLGGYAAGGNPRLLKGPGDGMSDNIPATINGRQPARLADGEFVIPADVVSHLGNGSTEAGAKQLHAMMNKVRKARTGNPKQGKNIRPQKYIPK
jgi:hypothetical protein